MKPLVRAQNGLGFDARDPYFDQPTIDPYTDVLKSAGSAYLGAGTQSKAWFDHLYPDDPERAKREAKRSSIAQGVVGGLSALSTQYGERQDYKRNAKWIADQKAKDYYHLPYDRYSYNENLSNPYNQTAYRQGGKTRGYYQDGGMEPDTENTETWDDSEAPSEQVVFDSTGQGDGDGRDWEGMGDYDTYEDPLPLTPDGEVDYSAFRPTLGNSPLRTNITSGDVASTVSAIGQHESGGDYGAVNTMGGKAALNATGKYQFVPKYWAPEIAKFQGTEGKTQAETMEAFRQNPRVQEAFMNHVVSTYYLPEVKNLLPYAKRYGIDQAGLIKMLHYRGISDTKRRLFSGDFSVSQKEKTLYGNPDILQYVRGK